LILFLIFLWRYCFYFFICVSLTRATKQTFSHSFFSPFFWLCDVTDSKKRKLAFESSTKPGSKVTSAKAPAARSNKARVEVEYEMEEEGERVPAQLRILAAQAAQANSRGGGGGGGRSTRSVLKR